MQLLANAVHIFGSVDFLGNPIGLINDLTSGISGLVDLDVGSLIRHVAHGVGDSTAKVNCVSLTFFSIAIGRIVKAHATVSIYAMFLIMSSYFLNL